MKKMVYRTNYKKDIGEPENECLVGFDPGYLWKKLHWRGPNESGRYLVITQDGSIQDMYCTGDTDVVEKARELFKLAVNVQEEFGTPYIDGKEMTDEDLMDLYRYPWGRWYRLVECPDDDLFKHELYVYSNKSDKYPLYYLELDLDKPIQLTSNGELAGAHDIVYVDLHGETVKGE